MALTSVDFISPVGNITGDMFPGEDLDTKIDGYITDLTDEIDTILSGDRLETAVFYGVYVRLYEAAASIVIPEPVQGSVVDQASAQYAQNRTDLYLKLAAKYQALYNAMFSGTVPNPPRYPYGPVPTRVNAP